MRKRLASTAGCLSLVLLAALPGCTITVAPPPEAVLEGTWLLTGDVIAPDVSEFLITFDSDGEITRISYTYANSITVTSNDPDFIDSDSTVDGDAVTINVTWLFVNNLVLTGTLDAAQDQITGEASFRLNIGSIEIEAPLGDAVLTRQ